MRTTRICIFLFMSLGLALSVLSDKCPDHARLPTTCKCEVDFLIPGVEVKLLCSSANLLELRDALNLIDKSARFAVHLDNMTLDPLPSDIFNGWNVVLIDISHCELDGLSNQGQVPFSGLEDKLEELVITSSFTEEYEYTKLDFGHLNRLRVLDLTYNAITELSDDWFRKGPVSLTHLMLFNNGIDKMGDHAFANLENLEELVMHGNRFGNLKRSMLPRYGGKLEHLNLDNNAFTCLPDDLFTGMHYLKEIVINSNYIQHIQEKLFKPIWPQLVSLDATGNPLECDSGMEWMFRINSDVRVYGTCEDRQGEDLAHFIRNKGQ